MVVPLSMFVWRVSERRGGPHHSKCVLSYSPTFGERLSKKSLSGVSSTDIVGTTQRIGPFCPVSWLLQRYAMVLDLGLIGCLVQYRGCCGSLLILTEPR